MACFVPEVHAEKSKTEAWLNEVCTGIPDVFHRRKKRRELCRTETHQILTQQFHEQFWPIRFFHKYKNHNLSIFHMFVWKRYSSTHFFEEEILRGLFRFAASVADVPTLVRLQVLQLCATHASWATWSSCATFFQVVGDFNAVLRAPRESEKSICWEFLRTVSTAHAWVVAAVQTLAISACLSHWDPEVFVTVPCL